MGTPIESPPDGWGYAKGSPDFDEDFTLDHNDPFDSVLIDMLRTRRKKSADYAGTGHPNQNFYDTAYQLSSTAGSSVEQLLATKAARLRVLLPNLGTDAKPQNESIEDTLLDRAVYAVIALTIWREGGYHRHPRGVRLDSTEVGALEGDPIVKRVLRDNPQA